MKKILVVLILSVAQIGYAQSEDLKLPGERWLASFDMYVCNSNQVAVPAPSALEGYNITFKTVTTDRSLDNALLKANFEEAGAVCSYSAILLADNAAQTSTFVKSKAYDMNTGDEKVCRTGKKVLDDALQANKYLYYGHPHNLAIMLPGVGASEVCGEKAELIGINFVVKGLVSQ